MSSSCRESPSSTAFHSFNNLGEMPCESCNFQVSLSRVNFIYFLHHMKLLSPSRGECFNSEGKLHNKSQITQMFQVPTYCDLRFEVGEWNFKTQTPKKSCALSPTKQVRLLALGCTVAKIFLTITIWESSHMWHLGILCSV